MRQLMSFAAQRSAYSGPEARRMPAVGETGPGAATRARPTRAPATAARPPMAAVGRAPGWACFRIRAGVDGAGAEAEAELAG